MTGSARYAVAASTGIALGGMLMGCGAPPPDVELERLVLNQSRTEFFVAEAFPERWDFVCVLFNYQGAAKEVRRQFGAVYRSDDSENFSSGDYLSLFLIDVGRKYFTAKNIIVGNIFMDIKGDDFYEKKSGRYCIERDLAVFRKAIFPNDRSMYLLLERKTDD